MRRFLKKLSGTQRIGVLFAVAVLATAPFGGLAKAEDDPVRLELGTTYDLGRFEVRLDKVVSLPDLEPAVSPDSPDNRLLILDVQVTSSADEPLPFTDVTKAWSAKGLDARPWGFDPDPRLRAFSVDDAAEVSGYLNPGQSMRLALVIQYAADRDLSGFELSIYGSSFREDAYALSEGYWVIDELVARGPVEVEVKE